MLAPGAWHGYLAAVKVVAFFAVLFWYLPSLVLPFRRDDGRLDRLFVSLTCMAAATIVLVHVLASLGLYDPFSLAAGYIAIAGIVLWMRGRSPAVLLRRLGTRMVVKVLDTADRASPALASASASGLATRSDAGPTPGKRSLLGWAVSPVGGLMPVAVLAYAAYLRFHHSLSHAYLGAPDSYVHLAWVKYLGANQLYREGVYPHGYHAILSALAKLTFVDPLFVARFMGPVAGFLLVLSVYYVSRKLCRGGLETLAVPGTAVFALGAGLPSAMWMQAHALPQVFAAVFFLPGAYFAVRFLDRADRRDLALGALCVFVAATVYPGVAVYSALASVVAALAGLVAGPGAALVRRARQGLELVVWCGIAFASALVPLGLGRTLGASEAPATATLDGASAAAGAVVGRGLEGEPIGEPFALGALVLAGLLAVGLATRRGRGESAANAALPILAGATFVAMRGGGPGLGLPWGSAEPGMFFSLVACLVYAAGLRWVVAQFGPGPGLGLGPGLAAARSARPTRTYLAAGLAAFALAYLVLRYPAEPPAGVRMEYDASVNNYVRIRASFPALDWTMVSPPEQYAEILGEGWHYDSAAFVRDFEIARAADPSFSLPIPTTYIFLLAEKVPLASPLQLPAASGDASSSAAYSRLGDRASVQAAIIAWARTYMTAHDDMSVFYEDGETIVYMIERKRGGDPGRPEAAGAVGG